MNNFVEHINTLTQTYLNINRLMYSHINTKTHLHMGQLEDFRASQKRKDSAVSSEGEIPAKSIAKAKQIKRRMLGVSGGEGIRRSLEVPQAEGC